MELCFGVHQLSSCISLHNAVTKWLFFRLSVPAMSAKRIKTQNFVDKPLAQDGSHCPCIWCTSPQFFSCTAEFLQVARFNLHLHNLSQWNYFLSAISTNNPSQNKNNGWTFCGRCLFVSEVQPWADQAFFFAEGRSMWNQPCLASGIFSVIFTSINVSIETLLSIQITSV